MKPIRMIAAVLVATSLSACASQQLTTRNAPFEALPPETASQPAPTPVAAPLPSAALADVPQRPEIAQAQYAIVDFEIKVPKRLKSSEANLYYPVADIVWRGDPAGNRKQQVAAIFQEGIARAKPKLDGARGVKMDITVNRFHSVTEKARYTVGGVHSISFFLTVTDAETGEVLIANRKVKADLDALPGRVAMKADIQGRTMKERIQTHLGRVFAAELTLPNGWADMDRKLRRAVDQI